MSENDWDDISNEELKRVAPALLYLHRNFGTSVGSPDNSKSSDNAGAAQPDTRKQGDGRDS